MPKPLYVKSATARPEISTPTVNGLVPPWPSGTTACTRVESGWWTCRKPSTLTTAAASTSMPRKMPVIRAFDLMSSTPTAMASAITSAPARAGSSETTEDR